MADKHINRISRHLTCNSCKLITFDMFTAARNSNLISTTPRQADGVWLREHDLGEKSELGGRAHRLSLVFNILPDDVPIATLAHGGHIESI